MQKILLQLGLMANITEIFGFRGQKEVGETFEQTAVRELWEEAGLKPEDFELGPIVWASEFELVLSGVKRLMQQEFVVARTKTDSVYLNELTENEKKVVKTIRWFSLEEIKSTKKLIYPVLLPKFLPAILEGKYPKEPLDIDAGRNP